MTTTLVFIAQVKSPDYIVVQWRLNDGRLITTSVASIEDARRWLHQLVQWHRPTSIVAMIV